MSNHSHLKPLARIACLGLIAELALAACQKDTSIVPSTSGSDRAWISLGHQVIADGALDKVETETIDSCTAMGGCAFGVNATRYTKVRLIGKAIDAVGGIKSAKLTIETTTGRVLQTYEVTNSLDADGKAPSEFGFAGTDGAGGFGVLNTIDLAVDNYIQATLEVINFENNSNKLVIVFQPHDPVQASLSVTPGQIQAGQKAQLSFGASPMTSVSINPTTMTLFGVAEVSPSADTTYTLTVTQPFPSSKVGFPNVPPATGQTVHPTSATRQATLKVVQPPTPSSNPATGVFYLALQSVGFGSTYAWAYQFGLNTTGNLVRIKNLGPYAIELIGQGHSSDDCFDGSGSTVPLANQASTSAADITNLYGSPPQYPRGLAACAVIPPGTWPPQLLAVEITYTW